MSQTAELPVEANHSHAQIIQRVPRYARVLELGCGNGSMSRLLKQHCEAFIIGFDNDAHAAAQAEAYCDYVFVEDLDDPHCLDALQGEYFDVITLVDVLEHLKQPEQLLARLQPLLLDEGCLLLSVPNVAHASIRLELLNGKFAYETAGLLDATHIRFFTADTIQETLKQAGYGIHDLDYTWHDVPDDVIKEYLTAAGLTATPDAVAAFHKPEASAYQFIITATPHAVGDSYPFPHLLKPMDASWNTWNRVYGTLQVAEQQATELANALAQEQQKVSVLQETLHATADELQRVYATRSWQMLRKSAETWRNIQSRFTHP